MEYALLYLLHNIYCHLDWPKRYACVLFEDFLLALDTIRLHIMIILLLKLGLHKEQYFPGFIYPLYT